MNVPEDGIEGYSRRASAGSGISGWLYQHEVCLAYIPGASGS